MNWRFYPKCIVITLIILAYTPLIWWEKLRWNKRIRATEVKNPVFILGHQRSGTTYLHYLLGQDPQFRFLTVKESFMPWIHITAKRHLEWLLKRSMPDRRPMDNLKVGMALPFEPEYALGNMTTSTMLPGYLMPSQLYTTFRKTVMFDDANAKEEWKAALKYSMQKLTLVHGGRKLLTKAPENIGRVKEILEIFPDAKFIHICRNPYRVYFSTERLYRITLPYVAMEYCSEEKVQTFIIQAYREIFERYFENRKLIPEGNLVEIRYEDLIGNEMNILRNTYLKLGLDFETAAPFINAEVKDHHGYQTNEYDYDPEMMRRVYAAWKSIFKELGYAE